MNLQNVEFIKSAASPAGFIRDGRAQIIFSGKSNVGKSSLINRVLNRKNFARVGSQPGKTVQINYFLLDKTFYLVDLPGYGYAQVSKGERDRWAKLMENYFAESGLIRGAVMLVDCRHKPTADDITMAGWFKSTGCPVIVAANKADKVKKSELAGNLSLIRETLGFDEATEILPVSAETGLNREALVAAVLRMSKEKEQKISGEENE